MKDEVNVSVELRLLAEKINDGELSEEGVINALESIVYLLKEENERVILH